MRKTMVIAAREYNAAVRTKAFVISLILLPVMMGGGTFFQVMANKYGADTKERKIAIIDRTAGGALFPVLKMSADDRNKNKIFDSDTKRQVEPVFTLMQIDPSVDDQASIDKQRFELSEKVRSGEYFAFIDLGRKMLDAPPEKADGGDSSTSAVPTTVPAAQSTLSADKLPEEFLALYTSNTPTYTLVQRWAQGALMKAVYARRFTPYVKSLSTDQVLALMIPPSVIPKSLAKADAGGKIGYEVEQNQAVNIIMPIVLIFLMFVIVLVGASPMTMNVMEEKQLRIAEVLLGSLRPFELMMGKLLGGAGVAITLMAIYLGGAMWAAKRFDVIQYVTPQLLLWFAAFCVISVFMYGSMFVAVGAAVSNAKEAQSLITPIMMVIILPMMILGQLLQSPSGMLATAFSFFPPSTPMVMMARLSIPPGIPAWQPLIALVGVLLTTILIVWAAGRIFRVGILMQGQGAKLGEMMKWVVKG